MFGNLIWRIAQSDEVFLTFDDGPIPEATPWVLDQLNKYNAKATFFCVGENVDRYPEIYYRILEEGHSVGNHTYNHLNQWNTKNNEYLKNVDKASKSILSDLFRPPYGKITPTIISKLRKEYDIIMWDVLSGDFDPSISKEDCLENVTQNAKKGSIIVFHDSIKAIDKLKFVLPKVLDHFSRQKIRMSSIRPSR